MNINLSELVKRVPAKGVLHVGANTCQELELYKSLGFENRVWIEPDKNLAFPKGERIINVAVSDCESQNEWMYKGSNNGESSSLLRPQKHLELYREIDFTQTFIITNVTTLEYILKISMRISTYNYLVLDIQGMELRALKGLGTFANHFEVIITEAYTEELYAGCGKVDEIIEHLDGYQLVERGDEVGKGWCDLAFIRKDLIKQP